jgi:hypothetical protein
MSVFAYFSTEKINSSEWLRERLKWDALRAQVEPVDLGVETTRPEDGGKTVSIQDYDPVLRWHCRF